MVQDQATRRAFALILADGSVVAWGNPFYMAVTAIRRLDPGGEKKIGDLSWPSGYPF